MVNHSKYKKLKKKDSRESYRKRAKIRWVSKQKSEELPKTLTNDNEILNFPATSNRPEQKSMESSSFVEQDERSVEYTTLENILPEHVEYSLLQSPRESDTRLRKILTAKRRLSRRDTDKSGCTSINNSPMPYEINVEDVEDNCSDNMVSHRIVDIPYFFKQLSDIASHDSLFHCGLSSLELKSEKKCGLISEFKLNCNMCRKEFNVKNTEAKLNKAAVAGVLAAGCGHAQLKQFSAAIDIPVMSEYTYKTAQDEVFDEWEVTAWEEMKKAGKREKESAIKEGKVDKNGVPVIDVIIDGCWCKRSYRTNYSALSGAAAIIGRRSGQVLFLAVKNKYCCICSRAEKRNEVVKEHECFKNFSGSSTAMESTILAEGFKQSIEMHGLIYARFIADGDSSTYAKILETRPYDSLTVEKISCKNHILRNFCTKLQSLKTDTKYAKQDRQLLTNPKILCARKYICDSMKYHGNPENRNSDSIKNLHKDINNSMHHSFGLHVDCNKNICSADQTLTLKEKQFFNCPLFLQIRYYVANVATQSRSLIENVDSNVVERFNGVIAKFSGGKRVNYALKRSYQARCAGAVISFNTGKILTTVHNTIHSASPSGQVKKFEKDVEKKRNYNRTQNRKKFRKIVRKKIDFDYGENATKPDMDSETFELAKLTFLKGLEKTEAERSDIEQRTILQGDCGEWLELRRNLLTASNFGKIVKRKKTNTCVSYVKDMLYKPNIDHVASICHGKKYERVALEQLPKLLNKNFQQCGLFIDEKYPYLGATPDGVAGDMLIEIKCPLAPYKMGIDAAIKQGKMHFWKIDKKTGNIFVNKKSDWYMQTQGQMHICKKPKCLLAVWYGDNKFKTEVLDKDDEFWKETMEPKLTDFYFDCLLPELVDPRFTRKLPIRDPAYVVKQTKKINKQNEEQNKEN